MRRMCRVTVGDVRARLCGGQVFGGRVSFFSSRRRHTRCLSDWSSDVCSSDLETLFTTDVGSVKMITSQAWTTYAPLTFFESNGLSAMSYSLPAAMALRLRHPDAPILRSEERRVGKGWRSRSSATDVEEH